MIRACQFCTTEFQARSFERYCSPKCVVRGRSKRNDAGCWIWQGHLNGDGYGMVGAWRRRGTERAHICCNADG